MDALTRTPLLCFLIWLFRMHTCFDAKRWSVIIAQSLSMNRSDMIYILWSKQVYIIILWHDLLRQPYLLQGSPWPGQGQPAKQLNRQMDPLWHDRDIEAKPWREILKQNNQQFIDLTMSTSDNALFRMGPSIQIKTWMQNPAHNKYKSANGKQIQMYL